MKIHEPRIERLSLKADSWIVNLVRALLSGHCLAQRRTHPVIQCIIETQIETFEFDGKNQ